MHEQVIMKSRRSKMFFTAFAISGGVVKDALGYAGYDPAKGVLKMPTASSSQMSISTIRITRKRAMR